MSKANAMQNFENGDKIAPIKSVVQENVGIHETENVWTRAKLILEESLQDYPDIHPKMQRHFDLILPHIAIYKALKETHPEAAMSIMEQGEAVSALKRGESFRKITKIPFGKTLFIRAFAVGCKSGFGAEAGFETNVHAATGRECRIDITKCPYKNLCAIYECPELTHIFCENDIYAYGNLSGIRFKREGTLATGANRCDFWLKKE